MIPRSELVALLDKLQSNPPTPNADESHHYVHAGKVGILDYILARYPAEEKEVEADKNCLSCNGTGQVEDRDSRDFAIQARCSCTFKDTP
jgi:hypothetical protein